MGGNRYTRMTWLLSIHSENRSRENQSSEMNRTKIISVPFERNNEMNCAERGEKELETNKATRPREGIGCSKHGCKFAWNVDGTRKHESYGLSRTIPYSRIGDSMPLRLTEEVILEYRRRRVCTLGRNFSFVPEERENRWEKREWREERARRVLEAGRAGLV